MRKGGIFFILILMSFSTVSVFGDSSRVIIPIEEDVFVDKSNFNNPESQKLMTGFGGTRTEFVAIEDQNILKPQVISNDVLPTTTYLKFDLTKIPSSTLLETVNVEDAKIKLFFASPDESDATDYILTVNYCADDNWEDKNIFWDNRPCMDNIEPIDTKIINENEIPGFVELNIIGAINKVKEEGKSKVTLTLDAQPILFDVKYEESEIGKVTNFVKDNWDLIQITDFNVDKKKLNKNFEGEVNREFKGIWKKYLEEDLLNMKFIQVRFNEEKLYSMNYSVINSHVLEISSSEEKQLGHATAPILIIDYSVVPSVFNDSVIFTLTVVLPTLTIVIPVIIWMYNKSKSK